VTHVIDVEVVAEDDLAVVVGAEVDMMIAVLEEILLVQEPTTGWSLKICPLVLLGRI